MTGLSLLTAALRRAFCCPREMAEVGGFSTSSAERYWNGVGIPNVVALSRLMRQSPELLVAFLQYVGLDEAALERETVRITEKLAELQAQRATLHASLDAAEVSPVGSPRMAVRKDPAYAQTATPRVLK